MAEKRFIIEVRTKGFARATRDFKQINQSVKPEKGKFVLFSSFLQHGCKASKSENIKYGISFNMKTLSVSEDV